MTNIAEFLRLLVAANADERAVEDAKSRLSVAYDELVHVCPHSEAVDRPSQLRGVGTTRRCKICGVTDYASEGGSRGDEYDYGYPGHPSKSFWENAEVETVDAKTFASYQRSHSYHVADGKVKK